MIAVDWGTSSFRAYRLAPSGVVLDRRDAPRGIMQVEGGRFAEVLRDAVGAWLAEGADRVLLCGMIGSRQGWVEAPYLACPAGLDELAAGLVAVPFEGASVRLVPGLRHEDEHGVPEVMRGEEVQIMSALAGPGADGGTQGDADGLICLPGTHSKWARVRAGRVEGFATYMTGEAFAALRDHTILGRMMRDGPADPAAFLRGVARSGQPGGWLHHLFGVRTLGLFGELAETDAADYLSGLLIGHELRAAMPAADPDTRPGGVEVHLIGAPALCALYRRAIEACGGRAAVADPDAAARGLHLIGSRAAWN